MVIALIGSPAAKPYAKHALITPENVATNKPFFKSNSLIDERFCSSDISFSLRIPAAPANTIPSKQIPTPARIVNPDRVPSTSLTNFPWKIGGISVPNAAVYPSATAIPNDIPRYRIVSPNVSPPSPHNTPNVYAQTTLCVGASWSTFIRSAVITAARIHGAIIQLKKPPTSQYVSQAQPFTLRNGT